MIYSFMPFFTKEGRKGNVVPPQGGGLGGVSVAETKVPPNHKIDSILSQYNIRQTI
jgi:hypothetical protein